MLLYLLQAAPSPNTTTSISSLSDPITMATVVIAVSTFFYSLFTFLLLRATVQNTKITNAIFEASHRPYLGILESQCVLDPEKKEMVFTMPLTNTGNVPANDVHRDLQILLDGAHLQMEKYESQGHCVMPRSNLNHTIVLSGDNFVKANSASTLNLRLSFRYKGVEQKQYEYEMECVYYRINHLLTTIKTKST